MHGWRPPTLRTMPARHVVLLGLMGSGKTSIGLRVAERMGWPLVDGDVWLEERAGGRTAAQIAEADSGRVQELLVDAWRRKAPKRVVATFDAGTAGDSGGGGSW